MPGRNVLGALTGGSRSWLWVLSWSMTSFRYMVTTNRVPLFRWLSTWMVPFIICTRLRVMGRPSPVPWVWLTRSSSARSKGVNIFS